MKVRHPWLIKASGLAGAMTLRLWMQTLRFQYRPLGPNFDPSQPGLRDRYIYAMWHEYLLLPISCYARPDIHVLISHSADGQLIAEVCQRLHIPVIRGSTSRGGVQAILELLQAGRRTHLALTPDGPRGPRQRVQAGAIYLASRLGLPLVPVGFGLERPWRMRTWDHFALPRPWARAACVTGEPVAVPAHLDKEQMESYRRQLEMALVEATTAAEHWAESGTWQNVICCRTPAPLGLDCSATLTVNQPA